MEKFESVKKNICERYKEVSVVVFILMFERVSFFVFISLFMFSFIYSFIAYIAALPHAYGLCGKGG
jgi:hypothetical protein